MRDTLSFFANRPQHPDIAISRSPRCLLAVFLVASTIFLGFLGPGPVLGIAGPEASGLPEREDSRFYLCLERLLNRHGNLPENWPASLERQVVVQYLKEKHGVSTGECRFGRNLLGYGKSESKGRAIKDLQRGRVDGFGMPYDIILASSRFEARFLDDLASVAINQGWAAYNRELEDSVFVVLKADLHSQFGDVFRNFNGRKIHLLAREINLLGCPGSAAEDYESKLIPALEAADAVRARVFVGAKDQVPQIIPRPLTELLRSATGLRPHDPGSTGRAVEPPRSFSIEKIVLPDCDHELDSYLLNMSRYGSSLLPPDRSP